MSKLAHYLQEHVQGEVSVSPDARRYFATDASIFTVMPSVIVYPRGEQDVRKTVRFSWQLAERGRIVPITARGSGTDLSGAAIGSGIIMAFPAHMNRVLEFDSKTGVVTVEPGINYGKLQQTLQTHGRFLPPYPASVEYSTLGGAVANNAAGEMSVKYGTTRAYVKRLHVILANGEVIVTGRLTKRELGKKLGLTTLEGEVYRALDALFEEHAETLRSSPRNVTKNASGYDLLDVRHADGSFDLTPLFVGSQGTLGIITEVMLDTEEHNPETTLLVASFNDAESMQAAVQELRTSHQAPCSIEFVNRGLLDLATSLNPAQFKHVLQEPYPAYMVFIKYDDNRRNQKKNAHKGLKLLKKYAGHVQQVNTAADQEMFERVRQVSGIMATQANGSARALPLIDDGIVPLDQFAAFVRGVSELLERNHVPGALWGHAGDGHLHLQPSLDLAQLGDRQTAFRLMDEYYALVAELGGVSSGEFGDGRLRGPYLPKLYGSEMYEVLRKVKHIFDPHGMLNPGVKIDVTLETIKPLLRQEYALGHLQQHAPRS